LTRHHKSCHAGAGEPFELRGEELATAILRVHRPLHLVMELAHSDWLVAVFVPPDCEQIGNRLPAFRACQGCGALFAVGGRRKQGTRRRDALYCDDKCRKAAHARKASARKVI
jgi:hypothetical protein